MVLSVTVPQAWMTYQAQNWTVARELYQQCLAEDANYAPAWARLARDYGTTHGCHATAARILRMLADNSIERVFKSGLHEFLTDFISRNNSLGIEIAQAYNFD